MANQSAQFMKNAFIGWTETTGLKYAHDYDPEKVRAASAKERMAQKKMGTYKKPIVNMRMIIPFTFICDTCHEFNNTGKKCNFLMEKVKGAEYFGVPVYRFHGKCTNCSAKYTFKTDPASKGYLLESGGKRTYEYSADAGAVNAAAQGAVEDGKDDRMKGLELAAMQARENL